VDVLRELLAKWPGSGRDEAFSIAFVLGRSEILSVLKGLSFVWTGHVVDLLQCLPPEETGRVCGQYVLDLGGRLGLGYWEEEPLRVAVALRVMVSRGAVTREYVEAAMRILVWQVEAWEEELRGWESDEVFLAGLRALNVRVTEICMGSARLGVGGARLLEIFLGDLRRSDMDPYELVDPREWPELLARGVPVRWAEVQRRCGVSANASAEG
jgi:hypothetical protein